MHDLQVMCPLSPSIAHMSPCVAGLIGPQTAARRRELQLAGACSVTRHWPGTVYTRHIDTSHSTLVITPTPCIQCTLVSNNTDII